MRYVKYTELRIGDIIHGIEQEDRMFVISAGILVKDINGDRVLLEYSYGDTEEVPLSTNFWVREA